MVILCVQDDEQRQLLLLQAEGFRVMGVGDGEAAQEASRNYSGSIDLLISDVQMTGMNGWEVCRNIGEECPETKMLMMSGALEARKPGCDEWFAFP